MEIRGLTEKEKLLLYGVTESEADEFLLLDFPRYYNKIYYSVLISVSLFIILAGIFGI